MPLKTEAKCRVFQQPPGTWRLLMHWKIWFDRYYCINSSKMLKHNGNGRALFSTSSQFQSADCYTHYPFLSKSSFQVMIIYHVFSPPLAEFHEFIFFTNIFTVACSVIFTISESALSIRNCFIDIFICKFDASSVLEYCPESCI